MHNLLVQHLASLCAFYKIKRWEDLERIQFEASPEQVKKLEQALIAKGWFKAVERGWWPGVPEAATALELWPKDEKLDVVKIIICRFAPFVFSEILRKEGFGAIDLTLPTTKHILESKAYQKFLAAEKKPLSAATMRLHGQTLPIIAASGFVHVPKKILEQHPREKGIPKFLQTRSIRFFYFHSLDCGLWKKGSL